VTAPVNVRVTAGSGDVCSTILIGTGSDGRDPGGMATGGAPVSAPVGGLGRGCGGVATESAPIAGSAIVGAALGAAVTPGSWRVGAIVAGSSAEPHSMQNR